MFSKLLLQQKFEQIFDKNFKILKKKNPGLKSKYLKIVRVRSILIGCD